MKGFVLPFALYTLIGLVLSPAGFLHASPPAGSLGYCLPFGYEEWQLEHPRPAAKRLADLDTGEPRTVRLFYFLPNDRPFREGVVEKMKTSIRRTQTFFGEQMEVHGFGFKTFPIETDGQGEPLVHRVEGQYPDSQYLDQTWALVGEIEQMFDLSKSIGVFVIDNSTNLIDRTVSGVATWSSKQSGAVLLPDEFGWQTLAHELGHACGMGHDFRDDTYIMSYGADQRALSACSAGFLAVHPYFNPDVGVEWAEAPTIELLSGLWYPEGSESVPIRLRLTDAHGLQQVRLRIPTRGRHPLRPGGTQLKTCRGLMGEEEAVVEIDYDGAVPSGGAHGNSDLSDPKVHPISVSVVDRDGNREGIRFDLWEVSRQHLATFELAVEVHAVAFAPGGRTLASVSGDGIKLWDLETRTGTATSLSGGATAVALSPDGSTLASGSGGQVQLLDIASGQVAATLSGHTHPIRSLAFSPDGAMLASGGPDAVRLWDLETQTSTATLPVGVTSVAFSSDGAILASGSGDGVQLWDLETQTDVATYRHSGDRWGPGVNTVAFSPDGTLIASGGDDTTVRLWSVGTGEEVAILEGHDDPVTTVAFSTAGTLLASGAGQEEIILWDVLTEIDVATLRGQGRGANTVAFSPDNTTLAAGWQDGGIGLWDISEWLRPRPGTLVRISGDGQRGPIEVPLDHPLVVEVRDQYGNPLEGAQVTFSVTAGDGKLNKRFAVENATTGLDGRAESILTLGVHPGTNTVEVSIPGLEQVTFHAVGVGTPAVAMDGDSRTWHLPEGAIARLGKGGIGRNDGAVAFSPDDRYLAVASGIGVWLYDVAAPGSLALWPSDQVHSVAFSPDGNTLAAGLVNDTVELWDVETGYKTASLANPGATALSFSPDGNTLAAASNQAVLLWDVATGTKAPTFAGHSARITSVVFSPDGTTLAAGAQDGGVRVWDVATWKRTTFSGTDTFSGLTRPANSVAFSPDGTMLATGSTNRTVTLWDVATGTNTTTLTGHSAGVNSVAFSPDGRTLASGSRDGTVKLWDIATGRNTTTLSGNAERVGDGVVSVEFSFDGTMLASGSHDGSVRIWDVATGNAATLDGHFSRVESVAYSPDGAMLAAGSAGGTIQLWDVAMGQRTATLSELNGVYSVAFSPDGTVLAGSGGRTIQLWDVATRTSTATLFGHSRLILSVSFSPDGTMLASGAQDFTAKLWDVATGTNTATLEGHTAPVETVAFSPDGTRLASGAGDGTIRLWDVATYTNTVTFPGHESAVFSVAFSPDGTMLASGSQDFTVKLWDVETGSNTATFGRHSFMVHSVAFSPDGTMLASGSGNLEGRIKLWDVETGTSTATLAGQSGWVNSVAFSPDGTTLASGADDGTVLLWDTQLLLPRPRTLAKISGNEQQAEPGAQLTEPFVVSVLDQYGDPFPGAEVTFSVTAGGGALSETTVTTDANGRASTTLTLGNEPGRNTVVARVAELKPVIFSATEKGKPSTLTKVSGDGQQGPAGAPLAEPFVVSVLDQNGNPFAGAIVHFAITGRGALSTFTAVTDTNGRAFTTLTLGSWPGVISVDATVTGLDPVTFTATGLAVPKTLRKISGDEQNGVPRTSLSEPFVVSVLDPNRAAVSGVIVTFAVTGGGGTLSATTVTTDENGLAATILTLGNLPETNTVTATVASLDPVTFTATADATPDFDGDGETGFSDFFLFADAFGGSDPRFDLDGSGTVDFGDFFLLADYFGDPARGKLLALAREMIGLPDGPQLQQNAPNPFNSETVISWFLLRPGPARVEVFALTGQRVAVLHEGPKKAGFHRVHWDGRDDRGRPLASGVYLYRLVTVERIQTRKLTLLR